MTREIATIAIYPSQGRSHSTAEDLSALAAYTHALLSALPAAERCRHVVLTNVKDDRPGIYTEGGLEVREVWEKGRLRLVRQVIHAVRRTRGLKLVHLQHEFNQFGPPRTIPLIPLLVWVLRFALRKKVIITYHEVVGRDLLTPELAGRIALPVSPTIGVRLFRMYYRLTSFASNQVFVQHPRLGAILRDEMGVSVPIDVLPIGAEIDVELADRAGSRNRYGFRSDERVLLFFGVLDWRKGVHVLLDAFEMLPPGFRLLIAGGQPVNRRATPAYEAWYSDISSRVEEDGRIVSLGFVDEEDIPAVFAAADLVVLPYVVPQLVSAVLAHAASYERPFIASDAFADHVDKSLRFAADAESLVEKILWSFDGHRAELAAYSRRYKHENSWERSSRILTQAYNLLLEAPTSKE